MSANLCRFLIALSAMLCMVFGVNSALAAPQEPPAATASADLPGEPAVEADDGLESLLVEVVTSLDHAFIDDEADTFRRDLGEPAPTAWPPARLVSGRSTGALDRPPRAL